jgi:hypothetical protein
VLPLVWIHPDDDLPVLGVGSHASVPGLPPVLFTKTLLRMIQSRNVKLHGNLSGGVKEEAKGKCVAG